MLGTFQIDFSDSRQRKALRALIDSLDGAAASNLALADLTKGKNKKWLAHYAAGTFTEATQRKARQAIAARPLKPRKSRKGKPWSKADIAYLRDHYATMTATQLAEKLKRENPQSIYQAALRFKIKPHLRVVA